MRRHVMAVSAALVLLLSAAASARESPAAPDEVDARLLRGADLTLPELLRAGGKFSYLMVAFSVAVVAACVYCALETRRGRVFPGAVHPEVMARLATRDRAGAARAVEGRDTFYARGAGILVSQDVCRPAGTSGPQWTGLDSPAGGVRALLKAAAERDAAALRGALAVLPGLGALSCLVGFLATITGMIGAFGVAASEVYVPKLAFAAAFKALVTSFFGVLIATVALAVYLFLSWRLERALADAAFAFEEIFSSLAWTASREEEEQVPRGRDDAPARAGGRETPP